MKTQVKHGKPGTRKPAATNSRSFRTFLLVSQFEARAIGARIAQARKEAGFTQEELAEMASFSKRSLQDYEGGKTIPYRHLREIGALTRKTPEWFLYGEEAETPDLAARLGALEEQVTRGFESLERMLDGPAGPRRRRAAQ